MPNILTHFTFAKENVIDASKEHLDATYVGAQGPDPFFYWGVLPLRARPHKKDVPRLGGLTQHMELTEPYWAMIEYARQSPDKELLFAYIDGLFMHYAVDRTCHPYVFYNTGFTDRPEDSEEIHHHYNFGHLYFENILDLIIAKREGTFTRPDRVIALKEKDLKAVSLMWYEVNKAIQKIPNIKPDTFAKCLRDYRSTMRLAYDPHHWKKDLFKKVFGGESFPYGLVYPRDLTGFEGVDFLNEKHAEWRMPAGERRTDSFDDLLREADVIYEALHECLLLAKKGEDTKKGIDLIAHHINHEGIVPGSPKIYWKLIWPASFQKDLIEPPED